MKLTKAISLKELTGLIKAELKGSPDHLITGINEIHKVEKGDLTFVDNEKYYDRALQSDASTIIIDKEITDTNGKIIIVSDDPFRDYNYLVNYFSPFQSSSRNISDTAKIGKDSIIQPNVFIGNNVQIGNGCLIR